MRSILLGEADAAVVGGAEAGTTRFTRAIFNAAGAISPDGNSTPFDEERNGFNLGEGAGILVLESAENARARAPRYWAKSQGTGSPQTPTTLRHRTRTASMRPMPSTVRLKPRGQPPSRCRM
uniref:beta-ketoacyl synthase N-terminal-like domain-containing protein n=1 Tax=Rothia dentocariosa TaxID=2047 RepID=UPI003FA34E35